MTIHRMYVLDYQTKNKNSKFDEKYTLTESQLKHATQVLASNET